MEKLLKEIVDSLDRLHEKVNNLDDAMKHYGQRLERLEKMDSIEHRVEVNQIDLSDIKEIVEKVAELQMKETQEISFFIKSYLKNSYLHDELSLIHRRLDLHLSKIAKNEEAIFMLEKNK
ncbi:hypothetical protein ACF5W4_10190 [Bacillota bacterium Lsc_1132]